MLVFVLGWLEVGGVGFFVFGFGCCVVVWWLDGNVLWWFDWFVVCCG